MTKEEAINLIKLSRFSVNMKKLNRFSVSLAFILASLAATLTAVFACAKGVSSMWTIFCRSAISFFLFAVTGFVIASLLWREYARITMTAVENEDGSDAAPEDGHATPTSPENAADVLGAFATGDSFDQIVVVDNEQERK